MVACSNVALFTLVLVLVPSILVLVLVLECKDGSLSFPFSFMDAGTVCLWSLPVFVFDFVPVLGIGVVVVRVRVVVLSCCTGASWCGGLSSIPFSKARNDKREVSCGCCEGMLMLNDVDKSSSDDSVVC